MVYVMIASNEIEARVEQMNTDEVFSVADLGFPPDWYDNVRIKLSRMVAKGLIVRWARGDTTSLGKRSLVSCSQAAKKL